MIQGASYWINRRGEVLSLGTSKHISDVTQYPEKFGLTKDYVFQRYSQFGEPMGYEGKAREVIIHEILKKGYIRVRLYVNKFWSINVFRLGNNEKAIITEWAFGAKNVKFAGPYMPVKILETSTGRTTSYDTIDEIASGKLIREDFQQTNIVVTWFDNILDWGETQYLVEAGGQEAGKMELLATPLEKARAYAEKVFAANGRELDKEIPNFDKNYLLAQSKARHGKTQRKDMPVIDTADVKAFQRRLSEGYIDIQRPFAPTTNTNDPYPEGLSGKAADEFLEGGLEIHDGHKTDDRVKVQKVKVQVGILLPIQRQIYFDKSINATAKSGVEGTKKFLASTFFILSSDHSIIDGHHRMLTGILVDPKMDINGLQIDLPIKELLPLSLSYGDAIGNKRNA